MAKDRAQAPQEPATDRVADTVNEFCDALRIGRSLFYSEVKSNRIKILKAGRKTLVPRTEREAWLRLLAGEANPRLSSRRTLRYGSKGSLAVYVAGPRRGTWSDYSADAGGGVLDLIARERGGNRRDALDWLRAERLVDAVDHVVREQAKPLAPPPATELQQYQTLSALGRQLWASCTPIAADDPAGRYLQARGCALPHPDGDLRWHPTLRHPCGYVGPALVALVTDVANADRRLNLHETWITTDGSGRKAFDHLPTDERPQARLVLSNHSTANGCIRLWPDCEVDTRLTVGEGIESCLAAALTHWPTWSCLNAGNLKILPLLAGVETLTIVCDHDPAGIAAALEVGARWRAADRQVAVLYPTSPKTDWADVVGAIGSTAKKVPA